MAVLGSEDVLGVRHVGLVMGWSQLARARWVVLLLLAALVVAGGMGAARLAPDLAHARWFVLLASATGTQLVVLLAPRVLWVQFETRTVWEDIRHDLPASLVLIAISNVVTVCGIAVCVTVLVHRFRIGDLLDMGTVAEVGSTLFLAKQAQAACGPPALKFGEFLAARRQRRVTADLLHRPPLSPV